MVERLLAFATTKNLIRCLILMLCMLALMNIGAWSFYKYNNGVGIIDLGGGANIFDNRLGGYTPDAVYAMISAYGEPGRHFHLLVTAVDMIFPAVLAGFYLLAIVYFYSRLAVVKKTIRWLLALPIICLLADYSENVAIVIMLLGFPGRYPVVAAVANAMFELKNFSSMASIVTVLIGLIGSLFHRRNGFAEN